MMIRNVTDAPTAYLPAARADQATVQRQHRLFAANATFQAILDAIPNGVVVLNQERQIVYANAAFAALSPEAELMEVLGQRVGEALHCLNVPENEGGCGTSTFCTTCGAAHAQAKALQGKRQVEECRILRQLDGNTVPLDLRVTATPHVVRNATFTIFVLSDIGDEKRRQVLERIFFHDIGNTAGNIRGLAELLTNGQNGDRRFAEMVYQASDRLLDEIEAQRQLLAAEEGDLEVTARPLALPRFLEELATFYGAHPVADGRSVWVAPAVPLSISTDGALLGRILGNMIKNGLEAIQPGEKVTLGYLSGYGSNEDRVRFWVHNPGVVPHAVQLQIFHRSFSTKSAGRGLGTYSMKLLAEQYLGGQVGFSSTAARGTVFFVDLPQW